MNCFASSIIVSFLAILIPRLPAKRYNLSVQRVGRRPTVRLQVVVSIREPLIFDTFTRSWEKGIGIGVRNPKIMYKLFYVIIIGIYETSEGVSLFFL